MKNIFFLIPFIATSLLGTKVSAQVKGNQTLGNSSINLSTAFFDASSSTLWNGASPGATNVGKGFLFPRTDLTSLVLTNNGSYLASNNPNRFDGIIVYNVGTGTTPATGSGIGNQTVSPGFYYFSNPGSPTSPATGQWLPMGGGSPKFNVTNAAAGTATNTLVDGNQVYAIKGQFTTTGSSTAVNIPVPSGFTSLYGITIFKTSGTGNKVVYARDLYSYDSTSGAAVTGSPNMSVVYPADTYDYVLEYIK